MKIRHFLVLVAAMGLMSFLNFGSFLLPQESTPTTLKNLVTDWNRIILAGEKDIDGYTPPVSARLHAYINGAAYLIFYPSLPNEVKFAPLDNLDPFESKSDIEKALAINVLYADLAKKFLPSANPTLVDRMQKLYQKNFALLSKKLSTQQIVECIGHGEMMAKNVWKDSSLDTYGHDAFLYNYDKNFAIPKCDSCWLQTGSRPMPPLLPQWGKNNTLVVDKHSFENFKPNIFSTDKKSEFYREALEVYYIHLLNSKVTSNIASYWADEDSKVGYNPVTRWIGITEEMIQKNGISDLGKILEIYTNVSFSLYDASVVVWHLKYKYNMIRPENYINNYIEKGWTPILNTPSFPSYPSGHATFGSTCSYVLSHYFPDDINIKDTSFELGKNDIHTYRVFPTLKAMANENATSRIYGGVHYRLDCEDGIKIGEIIGEKYVRLFDKNPDVSL